MPMAAPQDISLKVGEEAKLRGGFGGGWWIIYSGMPNRDTYSVALLRASGNSAAAYHLFLPTGQTEFAAAKGLIRVHSVSSQEIRLRFTR
jgi:hypothetical protein